MSRDVLNPERNYSSLSVRDLLQARDHYHWHLTHMKNVVGTAVGLYYIRTADPWPTKERPDKLMFHGKGEPTADAPRKPRPPRTFDNSEIRDYSWPCVIVLVDRWGDPPGTPNSPRVLRAEDFVPQTLYLPDGRTVPVCVVKVEPSEPDTRLLPQWTWPKSHVGGGFPLISSTQGRDNVASVGTLVSDGHTTYALTSRHVAGPVGHPVSTILGGRRADVGHSVDKQLTRLPFAEVYPEYVGRRTFLTLDAALVEVNDVDQWSSQIYGLPAPGELADLSEHNISTRLIDTEVEAYGAASGHLRGKVAGLFYRSRSRGGYDDVSDFLIAPMPGTTGSQPGDSGTVWHLAGREQDAPRPLALQWGGQRFGSGALSGLNFALASSLTTVLRLLDVELVTDHNTHAQPFWGKTGHYSIASLACTAVTRAQLATLMKANVDRVSFGEDDLSAKEIDKVTKAARNAKEFIPLADVPDLVWKNPPSVMPGGRAHGGNSPENPTHYADTDEPNAAGRTLREICLANTDKVDVAFWQEHFTGLGHTKQRERGLLPFRVWQFFDEMEASVRAKDVARYVCAAGLLAHYVGDACQPLHGSQFADGLPDGTGKGVHSAYETAMVDNNDLELLQRIRAALAAGTVDKPGQVRSGRGAAIATVKLIARTAGRVDPETLVRAYAVTQAGVTTTNPTKGKVVTDALWAEFGEATALNMADGILTLAMIWQAAWSEGKGDAISQTQLKAIDSATLKALYIDTKFVESLDLDHIAAVLKP